MQLSKFNKKNINISPLAKIGNNVKIGDNTTIYDNVEIGDNTIICNDCVIGEPLNDYYRNTDTYQNPATLIGADSFIRSHTIIYASSTIGTHFQTGHRVTIRENMTIGHHCSIGTLCDLQGRSTIGDYCRLHSNIFLCEYSTLGNFVFIYPQVVFTNDPTPPSNNLVGPTVGDYSQIAARCLLMPGIQVGKHCLIGACSTVTRDIDDYQLVIGSPAKVLKDVRQIKNRISNQLYYPWPYHFDRNMPWQGVDFDKWEKQHMEY